MEYRILIVEDEILLQKALSKLISEKTEYQITGMVSNGKDALEYLRFNRIDIVITDIRMPVMDGLALVQEIRESAIRTKVIVLSGYDDTAYVKHMLKYGACAYLQKPIVKEELFETLRSVTSSIIEEERNRNILKEYKFNALQNDGYVHFTDEMPVSLLNAEKVFACCAIFQDVPGSEELAKIQFELEHLFYPCCCFMMAANLFLVSNLDEVKTDKIEIAAELSEYFADRGMPVKLGVGLVVSGMMDVHQSMKQARHAVYFYKSLPYHAFVDYERVSMTEPLAITYPIAEERELIESVYYYNENDIRRDMTKFFSFFSAQDIHVIFILLAELAASCKHEFLNYEDDEWNEIFLQIHQHCGWQTILKRIESLLIRIQSQMKESRKQGGGSSIVQEVRKFIEEHLKETITLEDVANACFLSKSYFCKIFKEESGKTFKEYLNEVRIENAKILLKNTSMKNYEVAYEVGLKDASYFNELFKRITGMTPVEFRG